MRNVQKLLHVYVSKNIVMVVHVSQLYCNVRKYCHWDYIQSFTMMGGKIHNFENNEYLVVLLTCEVGICKEVI